MDVFRNLSSADAKITVATTITLFKEPQEVQRAYEQGDTEGNDDGDSKLEASKDICLKYCTPTMRYAICQLIRGISSSGANICRMLCQILWGEETWPSHVLSVRFHIRQLTLFAVSDKSLNIVNEESITRISFSR